MARFRSRRLLTKIRNPVRSVFKGPIRSPVRSPFSMYPVPHLQKPFVSPKRKRWGFRRPF